MITSKLKIFRNF